MTTTLQPAAQARSALTAAMLPAVASAAAFGLAGALARSLLDLGWSPAAVVAMRVGCSFLVLLVPSLLILRRTGWPAARESWRLLAYGIAAVGGAQLCYFSAVQYLSVGIALLLEYTAPLLLIGWHWARTRVRPPTAVFLGAALTIVGLALVLDLAHGLHVNLVGVAWGLAAAFCLACYFLLADEAPGVAPEHPIVLTAAGMGIGGLLIGFLGLVGVVPLVAHAGSATLAGLTVSWLLPAAGLVLVSGVFSYVTGVIAVRRLGSSVGSFVALSEVIFAVVFAALLLGQRPGPLQLVGGALILAGIATVQRCSAKLA